MTQGSKPQKSNDSKESSQSQRFIKFAREMECDDDEARWDERLKKVVKRKPEPDKG